MKTDSPVIENHAVATSNGAGGEPVGAWAGSLPATGNGRQASVKSAGPPAAASWQASIRDALRTAGDLRAAVGLPPGDDRDHGFPVMVTREFAGRIVRGDPHDPLLRQVLPVNAESASVVGFVNDPVGDPAAAAAPGLLHKYDGRALILTTPACGIHCRYCFRRTFDYKTHSGRTEQFASAIEYLQNNSSIAEVLLSGGDPLMMTDASLSQLIDQIESIEHVRRLRLHTRMPIVVPSRVTDALLQRLRSSRLAVWMVVHVNHAAEIDSATARALTRLVDAGVPVLNQSVLLAGVNDTVDALADLSERLIDLRVIPYYLHLLDRVAGAAHFDVPRPRAVALIDQLRGRLPGYAVPRLVREIAGQSSKTPIAGADDDAIV